MIFSKPWTPSDKHLQKLRQKAYSVERKRKGGEDRRKRRKLNGRQVEESKTKIKDINALTNVAHESDGEPGIQAQRSKMEDAKGEQTFEIPTPVAEQAPDNTRLQETFTLSKTKQTGFPGEHVPLLEIKNHESSSALLNVDLEQGPIQKNPGVRSQNVETIDLSSPSVGLSSDTERQDAFREPLQHESRGSVIINRGSPSQWSNPDLDVESSNEPPPGNQRALQRIVARSFDEDMASKPNYPPDEKMARSEIVNKGIPSGWDTLDVEGDAFVEHCLRVEQGEAWLKVCAEHNPDAKKTAQVPGNDVFDGREVHQNTEEASENILNEFRDVNKTFSWEEEWDRVEL